MTAATPTPIDIEAIFRDGRLIDDALRRAGIHAVREAARLGRPVVIWKDGKVAWADPHAILAATNQFDVPEQDG